MCAGSILYLRCRFAPEDEEDDKLFVFVAPNRRPLLFKIRSKLTDYAKDNPAIRKAQLPLLKHNYNDGEEILKRDSYLDCSRAYRLLSDEYIEDQLVEDRNRIRGQLCESDAAAVVQVVQNSVTLEPGEISAILAAFCD